MTLSPEKVVVAMSGGVDSSVAAAVLAERFEVIGLHFTKSELPGLDREVRQKDRRNVESAKRAAAALGICLRVAEAGARFDELVDLFCAEYNAGRTPNPCVLCNATLKWPVLLEAADEEGARFVATGHYARLGKEHNRLLLLRSLAERKDQTYFLHRLTQAQLARTIFPLGEMTKDETRECARRLGLPTAERSESQEICFVPEAGYADIIRARTPGALRPGAIVDPQGAVLGRHPGYQLFTIGQRKGLRVALGRPAYVMALDPATGEVTLGERADLESDVLRAEGVNWIEGHAPSAAFEATVRIRYNHEGTPAVVKPEATGAAVRFKTPVRAATPGQAVVFYVGERVVGGGWITRDGEFS
ncbi:MAG: tRNA 2-thiouridine(34) synthase MnmA [Planctomycetota bacterium]|jgi:tRNA-specific 2-thiouridylase